MFEKRKKQYKKFRAEQRQATSQNVRFYNFWPIDSIENHWFNRFIENRNLNPRKKPVNIFSVYGPKYFAKIPMRGVKVFYTGENVEHPWHIGYRDHCVNDVDISMGFAEQESKNYFRFPLWIIYLVDPKDSLEDLKQKIEKINSTENQSNPDRTKFAALVASHDLYGSREKIVDIAEKISVVEYAGKFRKNTDDLQEKFSDKKLEYLRQFRFNICPENTDTFGYVTEKLLEAFQSGCIPVYWGSDGNPEPEIFNHKAILFFDDNLEGKLKSLWENENELQKFIAEKPFLDGAAEKIWSKLEELERRLGQKI